MSIISTLAAADERLAGQIDKVSDAVQGIGAATQAARKRLALALDAARQRLTGALADVEALAGELAADLLAAAGEDLLAVPEPVSESEPAVPMSTEQQQKIVAMLDAEHPDFAPQTEEAETVAPAVDAPTGFRCLTCGVQLTEDANHCYPCYEAEFVPVNRVAEATDDFVNRGKNYHAACDKSLAAEAPPNGKPKKRRR